MRETNKLGLPPEIEERIRKAGHMRTVEIGYEIGEALAGLGLGLRTIKATVKRYLRSHPLAHR